MSVRSVRRILTSSGGMRRRRSIRRGFGCKAVPEAIAEATAERYFHAARHADNVAASFGIANFLDVVEIDEITAVAAHNSIHVERFLEMLQGLSDQVFPVPGIDSDIVAGGFQHTDLLGSNHALAGTGLHDQAAVRYGRCLVRRLSTEVPVGCNDGDDRNIDLDVLLVFDQQVVDPEILKDDAAFAQRVNDVA